MTSNDEIKTIELPRYEDGDTTTKLPAILLEDQSVVRSPDRSGVTIVVGSPLCRSGRALSPNYSSIGARRTAQLPVIQPEQSARHMLRHVTGSQLVRTLLASNVLVLCVGLGLFLGGLWVANEAGVIPDSVKPGILKSDPEPTRRAPAHKESSTPAPSRPSYRQENGTPTTPWSKRKRSMSPSPTTTASTSTSASPSSSASTTVLPEPPDSVSPTASPEPSASAITPTTSAPDPSESPSNPVPTSTVSEPAASPTGAAGSASPEGAVETAVNP